jgi:hypothetical protein
VQRGRERTSRVLLTWPYGGLAAEVSGELVGGWAERVPMTCCTQRRGCRGVRPGEWGVCGVCGGAEVEGCSSRGHELRGFQGRAHDQLHAMQWWWKVLDPLFSDYIPCCVRPPTHPPHTHTNPVRPPPPGQFYLEVRGLRPGRYHYKYIVDNTWAVDPFAPKDLDAVGE